MEIRQLQYVLETAKHKNFTKAAEALYTTQPNISKQISLLEEELNTKLFFRSHHSVILTKDGEVFCMHARKVIDELNALLRAFDGDNQEKKSKLSIAVFPFFDRLPMSNVLREFLINHTDNIIGTVRTADNFEAYRALDSGDAHFAIIKLRPEDQLSHFSYRTLVEEKLMLIIDKSHELASKEFVTKEDLEKYHYSSGDNFMSLYSGNAVHRMISSADFLVQLLTDIGGFTFMTESAGETVNNDDLKLIPLEPPVDYFTYLVYPADASYKGIYQDFIDYAQEKMAQ